MMMTIHSRPLVDANDLPWVADVLDIVDASRGEPWRVALERIEALQQQQTTSAKRFRAVVAAVQRVTGGRGRHAKLAQTCRSLVLGRPALSREERDDRIAAAARALDISCQAVEQALWADLPRERPVELPHGRPSELEVAAFANVQLIQGAVRKAQRVTLQIVGDGGPLLRGAAARGLLVSASVATFGPGETRGLAMESETRGVIIEIEGPIALCHRTAVYGNALASLVPLLADCKQWTMTMTATSFAGDYSTQFASPALLPVVPASLAAPSYVAKRLARDLAIARSAETGSSPSSQSSLSAPSSQSSLSARSSQSSLSARSSQSSLSPPSPSSSAASVAVAPPPIPHGSAYLCPDLVVDDTCIEVVGFWTRAYLERKLAAYAAAGLRVVLCVDELRGCADDDLPPSVVGFKKHVDVEAVLSRMNAA